MPTNPNSADVAAALDRAAAREATRAARPPINYALMSKQFPKQKAALTRAVNSGDRDRVVAACLKAMAEWDECGAWPDDWARWQRALDDVFPVFHSPQLEDLR